MRISLTYKLNFAIAVTTVVIMVVTAAVSVDIYRKRLSSTTESINLLLETLIQRDLEPLANELFEGRTRALNLRLAQIKKVPGMLEISIYDATGELLASTRGTEGHPITHLPTEDIQAIENGSLSRHGNWEEYSALYFGREIKIIGTNLGFITIYYSLETVEEALAKTRINLFGLVMLIFIIMFVVLNISLSRTITSPITRLRDAIDEMRRGDLGHRVTIHSHDEVGELAQAFNEMSSELGASYREIDSKNSELRERNSALRDEIADRIKAEGEAKRLQQLLGSVLDSVPSILISVAQDLTVNQWNLSAQEATGIPIERALGRPLVEVFPGLESELKHVEATIREGVPSVTRRRPHEADGETTYQDISVYPLIASAKSGAVIRVDDVTERVRIEEVMIQTEKMLSVGGLAAGMAHEINNPLGAILQGVQNIERRFSPDLPVNHKTAEELGASLETIHGYIEKRKIDRMLSGIRDAGKRAARIVSNMLDFSRKSESRMAPCDLREVISDTIQLAANDYDMKKKYDFRKILINREYADDLPPVVCIRTEIEQVLLNLMRNASQAMATMDDSHEPQITLRVFKNGNDAVMEVEDNGPGMDTILQKRIFEPFYTTKPPGVGTGLGLSVSYFIITQNHGGEFHVRSEPGRGATFVIRLPLGKRQTGEGDVSLRL